MCKYFIIVPACKNCFSQCNDSNMTAVRGHDEGPMVEFKLGVTLENIDINETSQLKKTIHSVSFIPSFLKIIDCF